MFTWLAGLPLFGLSAQAAEVAGPATPDCRIASSWCVQQPPGPPGYVPDELLLTYDSSRPASAAEGLIDRFRLREKRNDVLASVGTAMVTAAIGKRDPVALSQLINRSSDVVEAAPSKLFYAMDAAAPASGGRERGGYPLGLTGIEAVHRLTKGAGVKIGMIDTPIDISHFALQNAKVQRLELVHPGNAKNQQHGTEVAGILVSQNPRIGIAPEASLLAVSAFSVDVNNPDVRSSNAGLVARAIDLCIREGVDVLNLSFAGGQDKLVDRMIRKAVDSGIIVIAAAGNEGPAAAPAYPAATLGVKAVTAVDRAEQVFRDANQGDYIDLAAPGVDILTTAPRSSFNVTTGTSMAAAHVTGVVALLLSMRRQGFDQGILEKTATDLGEQGRDRAFGYGLVNAARAINTMK
ncbi:MAG: S8 family serine peptidase [Thiothrix sp.]|nr:S8 family serine peptidase [Thiothrix sp.]HPQ95205.1 S8 family serine peptidase [Thiolinea sp.]